MRTQFDKRVGTRMGRGDVRAAILTVLAEEPMHGYQVIRAIEDRTEGRWKPSAGSVYPTLQLLADEGLVTSKIVKERKTYSLTDEGREAAAEAEKAVPWAEDESASEEQSIGGELRKSAMDLAQAVAQLARTGSAEQKVSGAELLHETRRKIYSILAQD